VNSAVVTLLQMNTRLGFQEKLSWCKLLRDSYLINLVLRVLRLLSFMLRIIMLKLKVLTCPYRF
jgi:hypothetical protein